MFEDIKEVIRRVPLAEIPEDIPRVNASDIINEEALLGYVYKVDVQGTTYVMKAHQSASQNKFVPDRNQSTGQTSPSPAYYTISRRCR